MTWANPSGLITKFRDQLLLCADVTSSGLVSNDFHYPDFAAAGTTPDTIPAVLLQEPVEERERYAEGAIPLISGTLKAAFFFPLSIAVSAGFMETFARNVIKQLASQSPGISFKGYSTALSTDPKPSARAAGADDTTNLYRRVTITVTYGLSR